MAMLRWVALSALLGLTAIVNGQESTLQLESKVIGNQEQPRVMVIVPWQDASGSNDLFQEFTPQLQATDELLERATFVRELEFLRELDHPTAR